MKRANGVEAAVRGEPDATAGESNNSMSILPTKVDTDNQSRRGRGKSQASLDLIEASTEILQEIQPASVRAVCYRLFTQGRIPDMSKASTNKVGAQLVYARERGIIPWAWVVDETRDAERSSTWSTPDDIISAAVRGYRRDNWQDQEAHIEVWSEKGTVRGTLAPVLHQLGVTFRVMHGFASATAVNAIADESNHGGRPLTALYCGDYDPSGMFMSEVDLPDRLARYGAHVDVVRIALLKDDLPGLPHFDAATKASDARHRWFVEQYGLRCWELDAMPPPLLRERVRSAIWQYIDADAWNRAIEVEAVEVESMQNFHAEWNARVSGSAFK